MCTHRSHRCVQNYMNIMLCCLKCQFLLLYSRERMGRKSDFLQHSEVKKFKWQSQQRRKRLFFFFLLLPCWNLNLILVLSSGKVLLTPVQGHFQCPVRCSCPELCPLWGPGSSKGVSHPPRAKRHRIKEFPVPTSLSCSVHTREGAAGGPGLSWASALPRQRWEKGLPASQAGCWRILQQQRANLDPFPLLHLPAARMAEPALTQHKNPWAWWSRPSVEENPLEHMQRALENPI